MVILNDLKLYRMFKKVVECWTALVEQEYISESKYYLELIYNIHYKFKLMEQC